MKGHKQDPNQAGGPGPGKAGENQSTEGNSTPGPPNPSPGTEPRHDAPCPWGGEAGLGVPAHPGRGQEDGENSMW